MRPTLYAFAGGDAALLALARAHHTRCLADPELNHPFSHDDQHPQHVERLAAYWAEVLGGPTAYSQGCGTQTTLADMHCGDEDVSDLGARFFSCFVAAMDDAGLPEDPDFRRALTAYMAWAVEQFAGYPRPPHQAHGTAGGLPRWGWSGLES